MVPIVATGLSAVTRERVMHLRRKFGNFTVEREIVHIVKLYFHSSSRARVRRDDNAITMADLKFRDLTLKQYSSNSITCKMGGGMKCYQLADEISLCFEASTCGDERSAS